MSYHFGIIRWFWFLSGVHRGKFNIFGRGKTSVFLTLKNKCARGNHFLPLFQQKKFKGTMKIFVCNEVVVALEAEN